MIKEKTINVKNKIKKLLEKVCLVTNFLNTINLTLYKRIKAVWDKLYINNDYNGFNIDWNDLFC